jgi:GT2 family glycosyltransferase
MRRVQWDGTIRNRDRPKSEQAVRPVLAPPAAEPIGRGTPPSFSAIIAAYQAADFVCDAVESLLAQTSPPIEIIVCDDGSTDDLAGALAPYRDRLALLRKENGGEASAKNAAAKLASGEFVAILDADDVYHPERLEALAELSAHRPDLDILTTDCLLVANGQFIRNCYNDAYRFEIGDQRRGILKGNFVGPGHMAVRRERLLEVGGFDESFRRATDWDCWIRMIFAGSRVGMVDVPLAEYRVRESSLASNRIRQFEAYVAVLEKTARRSDLSSEERAVLNGSLTAQRQRLSLSRVETALVERRPDARRLALEIAFKRGFPAGVRLKAAIAAALPGSARRRLAARGRELAGGVRL